MPTTNATQTPISSYDVIAVQNIDDEDFTFEYGRSEGNYPYSIPAGEVRRFPRFIAEHAVKHLIDKLLNKAGKRTNDPVGRPDLARRIVVDEEVFQQGPIKTEADRQKEDIEKLNRPSDLEGVLGKLRTEEPKDVIDASHSGIDPAEPTEVFEGLNPGEEPLKGDELDTTETLAPETPPSVPTVPTRSEIYAYARKQGMVVGDKELKVFDKMKISDLITELGNPEEALV